MSEGTRKSPPRSGAARAPERGTRRITIREVAREAGVSLTTVSRVINDADAVRPEVRDRIRSTMKALGYVPDAVAQSMRRPATMTVGCIVPDIAFPAFSSTIGAVEERLRAAGYTMQVMASLEEPERERELLELAHRRRLDGIITTLGRDDDAAVEEALGQLTSPIVLLDRKVLSIDAVCIDHFRGAYQATDYLLQLGHRCIGLVTVSEHALPGRERRRAFYQAHADKGLSCNPDWIVGPGFESDYAYSTAYKFLSGRSCPTAIMAGGFPTIGILRAARSLGISIPDQLALISFGDTDFSDLLMPPFTVVRWDNRQVGNIAADILLSRMRGEGGPEPVRVTMPSELIIRGSCAPWNEPQGGL